MSLQLAFCLFRYFPYGGLQRDMLAIARACVARGHRVTVLTREWRGEREQGIAVCELPVRGLSNHRRDQRFARQVDEHLQRHSYDRVVGFNKMPGLDIYYAADSCFADKADQRGALYRATPRARAYLAMEAAVFGPAAPTRVLMISAAEQRRYHERYRLAEQRSVLLPPGIRRDRIIPADYAERRRAMRRELQLNEEDRLLLFIGSGFRTKGLDRALRALAALPAPHRHSTRLLVVGADRAGPYCAQARRLGVAGQVEFCGGRDDVAQLLWAGDLLLHPAYRENTGTVLLEAMVAGLPVVTTSACGYAHYVSDWEMGAVLPEPFEQSACDAIVQRLLDMPREHWQTQGARFSAGADIYSLVERAADHIEQWGGGGGSSVSA